MYVSNIYSLPSNPEQDICLHIRERPGGRRSPQASFLSHLLGLSAGHRQVRNRRKKNRYASSWNSPWSSLVKHDETFVISIIFIFLLRSVYACTSKIR